MNGISKSTVHRLFRAFAVQPHRTRTFKLSTDPFFIEKVHDMWGFISARPITRWCSVWTKRARFRRSIALSRSCPWGSDMWRVSPTTTSAMARPLCLLRSTSPPAPCKPRHRHQEFLAFLRRLDDCIPPELDVHLIVDKTSQSMAHLP